MLDSHGKFWVQQQSALLGSETRLPPSHLHLLSCNGYSGVDYPEVQSPSWEWEVMGRDFPVLLLGLGFYCIITSESRKMALRTAKKFLVFLMDTNKVRNIGMDKKTHWVVSLWVRFYHTRQSELASS